MKTISVSFSCLFYWILVSENIVISFSLVFLLIFISFGMYSWLYDLKRQSKAHSWANMIHFLVLIREKSVENKNQNSNSFFIMFLKVFDLNFTGSQNGSTTRTIICKGRIHRLQTWSSKSTRKHSSFEGRRMRR